MSTPDIRRANLADLIDLSFSGNQSALASVIDRQASYISRCLQEPGTKNAKTIGEKFARHIEAEVGLPRDILDVPNGVASFLQQQKDSHHRVEEPRSLYLTPMTEWGDDTPLGEDEVELPFFREVELSAGPGSVVMLETEGGKLRFGRRTLLRKNIPPECAACAMVAGNSMEPVLPDGTTVGINTADKQVRDGQMYALDHEGQLRVKVLYRRPAGGLRLYSYNEAEHPAEEYDAAYIAENIKVIGRVFWYSVLL